MSFPITVGTFKPSCPQLLQLFRRMLQCLIDKLMLEDLLSKQKSKAPITSDLNPTLMRNLITVLREKASPQWEVGGVQLQLFI